MNNRIDAIYARQSVDKKDSISIESQIEFCKYELKGGNCKEYTDKGYSGKNTDRPKFQELVRDIKRGLIAKVVVYKLDRISRSILDFANMMELFQQYNVEFVSSTEKFDTSTPMGRAMLNICIVFAQLERETIQKRVTDAYYSRSQRGFKMGGKAPYGFHTEPIKMDGINTKKLVVNPDEAANIRLMFEMYAQPTTSYGDITRYFAEQGILFHGKELIRPTLAQMLRNPVYVQADLDVYECRLSFGQYADYCGKRTGAVPRHCHSEFSRGGDHLHAAPGGGGTQGPSISRRRAFRRCRAYRRGADASRRAACDPGAAVSAELCSGGHALCGGGGADPGNVAGKALQHRHDFLCRGL